MDLNTICVEIHQYNNEFEHNLHRNTGITWIHLNAIWVKIHKLQCNVKR